MSREKRKHRRGARRKTSLPLEEKLEDKIASGRKLFVPYLTAGLPSPQRFVELISDLAPVADAIEVGVPFSDPMMDGPIIQEASKRALDQGVTLSSCFAMIREALRYSRVPIVVMTYFNPVHRSGTDRFCKIMEETGVSGLIVPDLPYEEGRELGTLLERSGIGLIQMVAPTTSPERTKMLASSSRGWVYAVSRLGVTGERDALDVSAREVVEKIRPHTDIAILLGTGISTGEQARAAAALADGVIVGSAMVKKIIGGDIAGAVALAREIRKSLDSR